MVVVGDIHGQYFDLIHMFEKIVDPKGLDNVNLLFLGDFVDRGQYSIEVLIFLLSLKVNYPKSVFMLRGNHESQSMTEMFTFRKEVMDKYNDEQIYEMFLDLFECFPLAADINTDYLCMHGGISKELTSLDSINKIYRHVEPGLKGFLCDLLWADPVKDQDCNRVNITSN